MTLPVYQRGPQNRIRWDAIHGFVCLFVHVPSYLSYFHPPAKAHPAWRKSRTPVNRLEPTNHFCRNHWYLPLACFMGKCRCFPTSVNLYWCYTHCFPHAFPLCFRGSKPRLITSSKPQESFEIWSQPQPQKKTLSTHLSSLTHVHGIKDKFTAHPAQFHGEKMVSSCFSSENHGKMGKTLVSSC